MRTKIIILILALLLLMFSASAITVYESECFDDGSIRITLKANNNRDTYTSSMEITADEKRVKGEWSSDKLTLTDRAYKEATFTGLENQLVEKKSYTIKIAYKEKTAAGEEAAELNFPLECPGLMFSCKRLGIKINDCTTSKRGKFAANLDVYGLEQSQKGALDPLKVVEYILDTQILYKDIDGYTSKRGSLPAGTTITKIGENKYLIEAEFDKYTTNHVKSMFARFNDKLPSPCNPTKYPEITLSHRQDCTYRETEEDFTADKQEEAQKEAQANPPTFEEMPIEQQITTVFNDISQLESKKSEIETQLNELYQKRDELSKDNSTEDVTKTGYSVKEPKTAASSKKSQLNTLLIFLSITVVAGGLLLGYLYKEGYFY